MKKTIIYGLVCVMLGIGATTVYSTAAETQAAPEINLEHLYRLMRTDPQMYRLYIDLYGKHLVTEPMNVQAFIDQLGSL